MDFIKIKISQTIYWKEGIFRVFNSYMTVNDKDWSKAREENGDKNLVYEMGFSLITKKEGKEGKICSKVWIESSTKKALFEINKVDVIGASQYKVEGFMYLPSSIEPKEVDHIQTVFLNPEGKIIIPKGYINSEYSVVKTDELFKKQLPVITQIEAEEFIVDLFVEGSRKTAEEIIEKEPVITSFADLENIDDEELEEEDTRRGIKYNRIPEAVTFEKYYFKDGNRDYDSELEYVNKIDYFHNRIHPNILQDLKEEDMLLKFLDEKGFELGQDSKKDNARVGTMKARQSFEEYIKNNKSLEEEFGQEDEEDLFENIESLPKEVQKVLNKYGKKSNLKHNDLEKFLDELKPLGYTFEYGLDLSPYNLRKI